MDDWKSIIEGDKRPDKLSQLPFHRPPQAWPEELPPQPVMQAEPGYLYVLMAWASPSFLAALPYDYSEVFCHPGEALELADELGHTTDCNRACIVKIRRGELLPEIIPYAIAKWRGIGFHWTLAKEE